MRKCARVLLPAVLVVAVVLFASSAHAYQLSGGPAYKQRVGFGGQATLDFNDCLRDYCDNERHFGGWDTQIFPSIGLSPGLFWRLHPNFALVLEGHTGLMNTSVGGYDDDFGLLFQVTFAAEFHIPVTDFIDTYVGFGVGYAYLGFWGEGKKSNTDVHASFHGVNFEPRTGLDVYPFPKLPKLSVGLLVRLGFPLWVGACWDADGQDRECDFPHDSDGWESDELPFLLHIGQTVKVKFK